jgi:hypothetical protein
MSMAHGVPSNGEAWSTSEPVAGEDGFRVSLSGASLPDLVQMTCLSRSGGVFRAVSNGRVGYLFFRDGQVVHALVGDTSGLPAAFEILKWNTGTFEPADRAWPSVTAIALDWQKLLLLAARQTDDVPVPANAALSARPAAARQPPRANDASRSSAPSSGAALAVAGVSVRVSPEGKILTGRGASEELAQIAAYSTRLAQLIGDAFGMESFSALESVHDEHRRLVHLDAKGEMVALTVPSQTELGAIRRKFGL